MDVGAPFDPGFLPVLLLATSLVPAAIIFVLPEAAERTRRSINMAGAIAKVALVVVLVAGVFAGREYEWRASFLPGVDLVLRADPVPLLFVFLSALLWLTTTIYAIGYLADDGHRSRFFGFFSLCVAATVGIALAGNLVTFVVFYELLTVTTYPLVVHQGDERARAAGRTYLFYTISGGAVLLVGAVWLQQLAGTVAFGRTEVLAALLPDHRASLTAIFVLLVAGLGVKAALVPLHGWLPQAMVAPAPVSALLHAVAVVKAGVFGIVRVVHDLYGAELAAALGVLTPLTLVAAATIVYGSLLALAQDDLKRRLAYSTVSQLSYIVLGIGVVGLTSVAGGLAHLVHQGVMKVTLFYCAGILARSAGVTRISRMGGVARRQPITMTAFTIAALGMVGVPPTVGFVTKWYLGVGAVEAGQPWVVGVLVASSALNAAYFLPLVARAWLPAATAAAEERGSDDAAVPVEVAPRSATGPGASAESSAGRSGFGSGASAESPTGRPARGPGASAESSAARSAWRPGASAEAGATRPGSSPSSAGPAASAGSPAGGEAHHLDVEVAGATFGPYRLGALRVPRVRLESDPWLLLPPVATAASVVVLGILAGVPLSPISWAYDIAVELLGRAP